MKTKLMKKGLFSIESIKRTFPLFIILLLAGCSVNTPDVVRPTQKSILSGKVQKGPFIEGANVDIFELDSVFAQTGKSFSTTIVDKNGSYMQRNLQLNSQFAEFRANGFYFNEVSGKKSETPLTLYAIVDLTSLDSVNINILTTIERQRIYQLLSEGKNFATAQQQAHNEALAVFGFTPSRTRNAATLSIENDAMLLVVSAIVQGLHSTAEITQLITGLSSDLRDNGTIDDSALTSALQNNFVGLNAEKLIENLSEYEISYSQSDVEACLTVFENNTNYSQTENVIYPEQSLYGENILTGGVFQHDQKYSFAAITPAWASLRVEVRSSASTEWYYEVMPNAPQNWVASAFTVVDDDYSTQIFTVIEPGKESVLKFVTPSNPTTLLFTFYEANGIPYQRQAIIE